MKFFLALFALLLVGGAVFFYPTAMGAVADPEKSAPSSELKAELEKKLDPLQYRVTMEDGTEPPFRNAFWDNETPGIYVCLISGEPLFSSKDKFKSGTGWPSFTQPLFPERIEEVSDTRYGMVRTEVRSVPGKSHLGHVFSDGPAPTGLRYCLNSAALEFIPATQLEDRGFSDLAGQFSSDSE